MDPHEREPHVTELETSFSLSGSRSLYVFSVLSVLLLVALLCYAYYRNNVIDQQFQLQSPVVQTCVNHRITQKVTVTGP